MNKLTLGIDFENHVFKLEKYRHMTYCSYEAALGDYRGCIEFKNRNMAFVKYKNVYFHGQITSERNWFIHITGKNIAVEISKKGENIIYDHEIYRNPYYKPQFDFSALIGNMNNLQVTKNVLDRNKATEIMHKCIEHNLDNYNKILNKKEFENQFLTLIEENFSDFGNEKEFVSNSSNYFASCVFIEQLNAEYVLQNFPELKQQKIDNIELNKFILEYFDYSDIDMWPETLKEDLHEAIIEEFELERQQEEKEDNNTIKLEETVYQTWNNKIVNLKQHDEFWGRMHYLIQIGEIKDNTDILIKGQEILNNCIIFEKEMEQYLSLWGSYKVITIDGDKKHRFESLNKHELSKEEQQEYELIYRVVMPYYTQCLYNKRTKKLKTIIQKFFSFITNAKYIIQLMLKYKLLIETQDYVQLGTAENIQLFLNELYKPHDSI